MGDHALAQDLVQEALVKTYEAWGRLRDPANAEAYARRVLVTTLVSWRRRRSWHERPHETLPDHVTDDPVQDVVDHDAVWRELQSLPARQRAALVLRYYAQGTVVHYGDRTFDIGVTVDLALAPTDHGFVVAGSTGEVFFSDGSETRKVGELAGRGNLMSLRSGDTGSLVAWVGRAEDGTAELVVFDSSRAETVARVSGHVLSRGSGGARVIAVDDGAVVWESNDVLLRYDVTTGRHAMVEPPPGQDEASVVDVADGVWGYLDVRRRNDRLLLGTPAGIRSALADVPVMPDLSPDASFVVGQESQVLVLDVSTGDPVELHLPRGYAAHWPMGWVDHETLAVWDADRETVLSCTVPSGSCEVSSKPPERFVRPIFPGYAPG